MKCFEPYNKDEGQSYARASSYVPKLCEKEILHMLTEIIKNVPNYNHDAENVLSTEQNAFIARNAEKYYRAMIKEVLPLGTLEMNTWSPPYNDL
ncbi:erythromycin esterase family protein [Flavobacterium yafengii]|uniref:erythromycin esterase family protein n=1 Tax=Flavobacterium yafengii TaxID=3041253 RepID=UPI003D7F7B1F